MNYKILCVIQLLTSSAFTQPLDGVLRYYETLRQIDVQHRIVRRGFTDKSTKSIVTKHHRIIKFNFLGREHLLDLHESSEVLSPNFKAYSVDSNGNATAFDIDRSKFFKGVLVGEEDSFVRAYIDHGVVDAKVIGKQDTIYIEPVFDEKKSSRDMIVYKLSDVLWNFTTTTNDSSLANHSRNCEAKVKIEQTTTDKQQQRYRRQSQSVATSKNICKLSLVADYEYFKHIGNADHVETVNYILQVITRVHDIFRKTKFTGIGVNIGFQVEDVTVHRSYTTNAYNVQRNGVWNVDKLLTAFSRTDWSNVCLAHLFTYQDFSNGIIGLAYVASPIPQQVGGICSPRYSDSIGRRYLNCGLSSSKNWGRRLLTVEADLVTAHEIGHNFGANHDPGNCQPSDSSGGKYIMYAHSVNGKESNNNKFSPCSVDEMGKVLLNKKSCFTNEVFDKQYCGNSLVEGDEECDSGLVNTDSKCCDRDCKLKVDPTNSSKKFQCNDINDRCCSNCTFAPATKVCRSKSKFHCSAEARCSGFNKTCPSPLGLSDNEPCGFSKGNCQRGKCVSLCEQRNKTKCLCSAPNSCKICCHGNQGDLNEEECMVLENDLDESDGSPCYTADSAQGKCVSGVCKKNKKNVEDEFSSLLDDFTLGKFVRFMNTNIVGTILVFSLLIWIPASVAVCYIDKRHDKENQFMQSWMHPKNKELLHSGAKLSQLFKRNTTALKPKKKIRTQYHLSS